MRVVEDVGVELAAMVKAFREAVASDSPEFDEPYFIRAGSALVEAGLIAEASEAFDEAVKRGGSAQALFVKGRHLVGIALSAYAEGLDEGIFSSAVDEAVNCLDAAVGGLQERVEVLRDYALALMLSGRYEEALLCGARWLAAAEGSGCE